jgi:hypothetical protein
MSELIAAAPAVIGGEDACLPRRPHALRHRSDEIIARPMTQRRRLPGGQAFDFRHSSR